MRYLIQEALGQGGSGAVFRAFDQQLSREVAIKRIRDDADIESSIRKEAGMLAALHHPNIVTIYDFAADEEGPFVVMELVSGRTLDEIITEHPMSLRTFYEMVDQICKGLSSAHARGLVHCDIKPKNIMLQFHGDNSFTVKILDFGLARMELELEEANADGTVAGTPHTISPEQLLRQPTDARSDIYSLGCVFYYALSGKFPHDAEEIEQIVQNHLNGGIIPLHRIKPNVPEPISVAISKMLSVDPNMRQQSAQEVRNSLWAAARAPSSKGPSSTTRHIDPGSKRVPAGQMPSGRISPIHPTMEAREIFKKMEAPASIPVQAPPKKSNARIVILVSAITLSLIAAAAWFLHNGGITITRTAPPSATTPAPTPTPSMADALPTIDALNTAAVEKNNGETVNITGAVTSVAQSLLFHGFYVKFSDTDSNVVRLSIPSEQATETQLKAFAGKRIRATGTITIKANILLLEVESLNDIKTL